MRSSGLGIRRAKGYGAFIQTQITLDIDFDPAVIDPAGGFTDYTTTIKVADVAPNSPSNAMSRSACRQRSSATRASTRSSGPQMSVPPRKPWPRSSMSRRNAVPPPLMKAIAAHVRETVLGKAARAA